MRCWNCLLFLFLLLLSTLSFGANIGNSSIVLKILQCESNFRSNVYGDGGKAYGIAQFHRPTFNRFAMKAAPEMIKAGLWPAQYKNPTHQVFLLDWAIKHNYGSSWTCYTKIKHQERMKKINEHRKRVEHFRNMYLRSHHNSIQQFVGIGIFHNLGRYACYRNYGTV